MSTTRPCSSSSYAYIAAYILLHIRIIAACLVMTCEGDLPNTYDMTYAYKYCTLRRGRPPIEIATQQQPCCNVDDNRYCRPIGPDDNGAEFSTSSPGSLKRAHPKPPRPSLCSVTMAALAAVRRCFIRSWGRWVSALESPLPAAAASHGGASCCSMSTWAPSGDAAANALSNRGSSRERFPVAIVGAGPTGLTLSILLSKLGMCVCASLSLVMTFAMPILSLPITRR